MLGESQGIQLVSRTAYSKQTRLVSRFAVHMCILVIAVKIFKFLNSKILLKWKAIRNY